MTTRESAKQQVMTALSDDSARLPDLIKIEKNLNYISFFSVTQSRRSTASGQKQTVRVITYPSRVINGELIRPKSTVKGDSELGLPTNADRDKYMAFMGIVTDLKARLGHVQNPIAFSTHELLKRCGLTDAGLNFDEANQFLERMVSTTIKSEYSVYFSGPRRHVTDIFHVFNRVVLAGQEMPDGTVAQMNYVYLSDWQLDNINSNYTFPVDHHAYRQLRRDVAKAVFGHLHTWFFASRGRRVERKYSELCQLLDIQRYKHISKAKQVLGPSFEELIKLGYVTDWNLLVTTDKTDFKLALSAGPRIMQIVRPRLGSASSCTLEDAENKVLVQALLERGIREGDARRLLLDIDLEAQPVMGQIAWFDEQVRQGCSVKNPAGFLLSCIRENWRIPIRFQNWPNPGRTDQHSLPSKSSSGTSDPLELRQHYWEWQDQQIEAAITRLYPAAEFEKQLRKIEKRILRSNPEMYEEGCAALAAHARLMLRTEVGATLDLPTFQQFRETRQPALF